MSDAFDEPVAAEEPIQKKKRIRPAGSKNKPKDKEPKEKEAKKTLKLSLAKGHSYPLDINLVEIMKTLMAK